MRMVIKRVFDPSTLAQRVRFTSRVSYWKPLFGSWSVMTTLSAAWGFRADPWLHCC